MTKPTPHEAAIANLEAKIVEARTIVADYDDQIVVLDRERFIVKARVAAYQETLALLTGSETAQPAAEPVPRAKKGEIETAITALLAKYPEGLVLSGVVRGTKHKINSINLALKRMKEAGTVERDGDKWRIPETQAQRMVREGHVDQPQAEQERSAAE